MPHFFFSLPSFWHKFSFGTAICVFFLGNHLAAVPQGTYASPNGGTSPIVLQEMRGSLTFLRNSAANHEQEIQECKAKFQSLEQIIDGLREAVNTQLKKERAHIKNSTAPIQAKNQDLEIEVDRINTELQQIKKKVNEFVELFAQYNQQIEELHRAHTMQNENLKNLHSAVKNIIDILQPTETKAGGHISYRVQNGDSLGKIAQINKTSVKALKELNNLSTDRITIGQELKIPQ